MYSEILSEQLQMNSNAMYLLLTWAVINIVGGIILSIIYKRRSILKHFFQMNALWNFINLGIAIGALYYISSINPAEMDLKQILYSVFTFEKLLLFNAGLNIAYIAIGSYMVERGLHHKRHLLEGFGKALWLQGGFLFLLDLALYYMNTVFNQRYSIFILF